MSNEFSDIFELNQELKVGKIEENPVLLHSQHIVWLNIEGNTWKEYVLNAFLRMKKEGYSPSDIVVLIPTHKMGKDAVEAFKERNIEVNHVFEISDEKRSHVHKKAFWMGDSRLKMCTLHSFKGWELLNIILLIPAYDHEHPKRLDAIVYTAITRTRENVIILNPNPRYNDFGSKFPKKWHEQ
jgi:hypothetical protein